MVESSFHDTVLARSYERPVVVLFTSGAVPFCRLFEQLVEREAREREGRIELATVEVDANPGLAARYNVRMVPAVRAFRRGRVVAGFQSARPPVAVSAFLDSLLGPSEAERLLEELRADHEWPDVVAALDESDYERAFELLLARADRGDASQRERVRKLMVALFADLGDDHPLTLRYRRRLAAALY
jgi:putative thioredoxin